MHKMICMYCGEIREVGYTGICEQCMDTIRFNDEITTIIKAAENLLERNGIIPATKSLETRILGGLHNV